MVTTLCSLLKSTQRSLKLRFQITVRRISYYFGSFVGKENKMVPYFRALGSVMSINTTSRNYGVIIVQYLNCGRSVPINTC